MVLDLDLTCIHSYDIKIYKDLNIASNPSPTNDFVKKRINIIKAVDILQQKFNEDTILSKVGEGNVTIMFFVKRPHLDEFLQFCVENFETVSIFSAGQYKYVHIIKEYLFPGKDILTLTIEDLIVDGKYCSGKNLDKVYSNIPGANSSNTILVDDNTEAFQNHKDNGIEIPEYNPFKKGKNDNLINPTADNLYNDKDNCLRDLMDFFKSSKFKSCKDVRKLNKKNIFK